MRFTYEFITMTILKSSAKSYNSKIIIIKNIKFEYVSTNV